MSKAAAKGSAEEKKERGVLMIDRLVEEFIND